MTKEVRASLLALVVLVAVIVLLAGSITTPTARALRLAEDGAALLAALADATVDAESDARIEADAGAASQDAGVSSTSRSTSTEQNGSPLRPLPSAGGARSRPGPPTRALPQGSTSTSRSTSTSTSTSPSSPPSSTPASLTLENTCTLTTEVFWLDEGGLERWRGFVGRGSVVTFETFEGHVFRVRPRGDRATELALVTASGNTHVEICAPSSALYDHAPPPPLASDRLPRTCTVDTGPATHVTFVSACDAPLELYWVDRACERRPYASIPPGGSHEQSTFVDHVWRAETPDGRVVEERAATLDDALWVLACPSAPR